MQVILKSTVLLPLSFTPVPLVACNFKAETLMVFDRESWLAGWSRRGFLKQQQDRYHDSLSHLPSECLPRIWYIQTLVRVYRARVRHKKVVWCGTAGSILILVEISGKFPPTGLSGNANYCKPSIACKEHEPGKSRFFDWCVEQVARFLTHQLYLFKADQRKRR